MTVLQEQIAPGAGPQQRDARSGQHGAGQAILPAWLFVILCLELLALSLILGAYLVLWDAWDAVPAHAPRAGELPWGLLSGVSLLLGSVAIGLATGHLRAGRGIVSVVLVGFTLMYGVLLLGGRLAEARSRWDTPTVYVRQYMPGYERSASRRQSIESEPRTVEGAAPATGQGVALEQRIEAGRALYMSSCLACHGPAGQGMAGAAPSFAETGFIFSASDEELVRVIRQGRPADDPANASGRAMPALGGNPFLGEAEVEQIAAFLRTLGDGGESDEATERRSHGGSDPLAMLPRWVVPPGTAQPPGVEQSVIGKWKGPAYLADEDAILSQRIALSEVLVRGALGVHSLHVLVGMGLLGLWAVAGGAPSRSRMVMSRLRRAGIWWHIGTATWLALFGVFYLLG